LQIGLRWRTEKEVISGKGIAIIFSSGSNSILSMYEDQPENVTVIEWCLHFLPIDNKPSGFKSGTF
jgi:hypothetical protein